MNRIIVETMEDIAALAAAIRDASRLGEAIVALTSRRGERIPSLDPGEVAEIVAENHGR
jgi:hypothetical protein